MSGFCNFYVTTTASERIENKALFSLVVIQPTNPKLKQPLVVYISNILRCCAMAW